ncbi:MAG: nucleotidyltransferase family protein [Desulfurococcales archaeon]|nr:nucleotidyltransferase family protein [Desulfurococcales archaeon]
MGGLAAILAGGYGKRLRPLTETIPKPLLEVANKPIIEHQIEWLSYYGFDEFLVMVGWLKEKIIERLGSGSKYGVTIIYSVEDEPLGTAGALKNAEGVLSKREKFLVVNGDIITNLDPTRLFDVLKNDILASMAAIPLKSPYGVMDIDENGYIRGFREKPIIKDYWINAGVYAMRPGVLEYVPQRGDLERTTFPDLAKNKLLIAVKYSLDKYYWRSIDSHKDLEEATKELKEIGGLIPKS